MCIPSETEHLFVCLCCSHVATFQPHIALFRLTNPTHAMVKARTLCTVYTSGVYIHRLLRCFSGLVSCAITKSKLICIHSNFMWLNSLSYTLNPIRMQNTCSWMVNIWKENSHQCRCNYFWSISNTHNSNFCFFFQWKMVEIIVATTMMITPTIIVQFKFIPFHKLQFKYWASSAQRINTSILADF